MEHKSHDKVFFVTFSVVLGVLGGLAVFIAIVAKIIAPEGEGFTDQQKTLLAERIRPVGQVITDPAALLKVAAKPARAPYTGEQVLANLCNACHLAGVNGAPKESDAGAWSARLKAAGSVDALAASAIKGKGAMPPKGGDPDLSDEEIKAAVEAMLKKAGV